MNMLTSISFKISRHGVTLAEVRAVPESVQGPRHVASRGFRTFGPSAGSGQRAGRLTHSPCVLALTLLFVGTVSASADASRNVTSATRASSQAGYHVHAHAHNDYIHDRPLFDALDNRFYSVEADIWLVDGEILVSHDRGNYEGNLQELYLDPLQNLVNKRGSVQGDGEAFCLWIDIKDSTPELLIALHELLMTYSMLSVFTDDLISQGAVTVTLTGNADSKESYVERYSERYATRDSNSYSETDPEADNRWRWYALPWRQYMQWDGQGEMTTEERSTLVRIVDDVHAKSRKVRLYATPETEAYWEIALETGVDLINTDDLVRLNRFLERYLEDTGQLQ